MKEMKINFNGYYKLENKNNIIINYSSFNTYQQKINHLS